METKYYEEIKDLEEYQKLQRKKLKKENCGIIN